MSKENYWINHFKNLADKNYESYKHNSYIFKKGTEHHREFIRSLIKNLKTKNVLDIGCGSGDVTGPLTNEIEVYGVDPVYKSCELAKKKGLKTINSTFADFKLERAFDSILVCEVLTLIDDTKKFLKLCNLNLVSEGSLIISVVNKTSLIRKVVNLMFNREEYGVDIFNLAKINYLLRTVDFSVCKVFYFYQSPFGGFSIKATSFDFLSPIFANNLIVIAKKPSKTE